MRQTFQAKDVPVKKLGFNALTAYIVISSYILSAAPKYNMKALKQQQQIYFIVHVKLLQKLYLDIYIPDL